MALISSIRSRSWILIVFIGIGLASFIMMDMFNSNTGAFGNRPTNTLGTINGKEIDYNKVRRTEEVFYRGATGSTYGLKDQLWNYYLEQSLLEDEGSKLGLNIGREEINDLMFGNNLSPIVQQIFTNPQTQQVDMARIAEVKDQIVNDREKINEPYIEELVAQVKKDRIQQKYNALVAQGFYTPNWMAEQLVNESNTMFDFNYVKVPFTGVADTEVSVSDEDYSAYLNNNKAAYMSDEETRKINYVVFDIYPSSADSSKYYGQLQNMVQGFKSAPNDSLYVAQKGGTMATAYVKSSSLSPEIQDRMASLPIGSVVGPYVEGSTYKLAKVSDRKVIADSVKAQHILIRANPADQVSFQNALVRIDSVKTAIDNGESFDNMAAQVSQDASNADQGGDLGYFAQGAMVQQFNDMAFYKAKVGEVNIVLTQFGVHLLKVNDKKFSSKEESIRVAYLTRSIVPSEETQKTTREKVQEFVNTHTTAADMEALVANDPSLRIQTTTNLKRNDFMVPALGQDPASRDMIRWAFDGTNVGDLSPDFYIYRYSNPVTYENYDSKYVIASLANIQKAGMPSVESIKSEIASLVMNEKKAAVIAGAVQGKDLQAVASQYGTTVGSLTGISGASTNLQSLGNEPKVAAALSNLDVNQKSGPIQGENGVYVVQVTNKTAAATGMDIANIKRVQSSSLKNLTRSALMQSLKDGAEVTDNRFKVY